MSVLERSSVLITGGTGSFGKAFARTLLDRVDPERLVIFSRDELKQFLGDIHTIVSSNAARLPSHADFIAATCAAPKLEMTT